MAILQKKKNYAYQPHSNNIHQLHNMCLSFCA